MSIYSVTDARANLPEILDRVEAGDEVTLTRHGRPVAVIVRPDDLRARRASQVLTESEQISQLLVDMKGQTRPESALSNDRAEELVAAVHAERDVVTGD
jgi:prevent-host-death family protein